MDASGKGFGDCLWHARDVDLMFAQLSWSHFGGHQDACSLSSSKDLQVYSNFVLMTDASVWRQAP